MHIVIIAIMQIVIVVIAIVLIIAIIALSLLSHSPSVNYTHFTKSGHKGATKF